MRTFVTSLVVFVFACTGGGGTLDGNGSTSSGGSSGGSSGTSGGSTERLRASDFSQSCSTDTDCVAVYEGAICNECGCANAAIAKSALSDYAARRDGASCPDSDAPCANDCANAIAICASGTCSITNEAQTTTDAGTD